MDRHFADASGRGDDVGKRLRAGGRRHRNDRLVREQLRDLEECADDEDAANILGNTLELLTWCRRRKGNEKEDSNFTAKKHDGRVRKKATITTIETRMIR